MPRHAYVSPGGTVPVPPVRHLNHNEYGKRIGWYADAACTIPFDFSKPITVSGVKIYAGALPPVTSERSDPTYTTRILTDTATGVKVTVGMNTSTRLHVTANTLHAAGSCLACDEIRARQAAGDVLALYDIFLTGYHTRPYKIYIPFSGSDGTYTVLHCNKGVLEQQSGLYASGGVSTTWSRLSPFAVVRGADITVPDNVVVDPPKTGDAGSPWGYLMMLAGVCGLVGLHAARRRKMAE